MNRVGEGRVAVARHREGMSHENGGGEARHTRERGRMEERGGNYNMGGRIRRRPCQE